MTRTTLGSALLSLTLFGISATAHAGGPPPAPTKITWLGHAAFEIVTPNGKVLLLDPWVKNPLNPSKTPIADIKKADYILLTHGHFDHVGDTVAIAKATGARLVTNFELGQNLVRTQGFPAAQLGFDTLGNIGGEIVIADGEVEVDFVPAIHSSGLDVPGAEKTGAPIVYGGSPCGFVIKIKNGPNIWDTGDTAYFSDMSLIGKDGPIDLALINIGGHFGMEPGQAFHAAGAVNARWVIPQHYKTFPILTQDTKGFYSLLDKESIKHIDIAPGASVIFEGHNYKK